MDLQDIQHHFGGDVYIKRTRFEAGDILVQHKHAFDHLSYLVCGTVDVNVDGVTTRYVDEACILIEAGKHHGVRAITGAVWLCVHATTCTDVDKVDEVLIVPGEQDDMRAVAEALL